MPSAPAATPGRVASSVISAPSAPGPALSPSGSPPSRSGFVNSGSHLFFCSSVPLDLMPAMASPIEWMHTAMPAQPHDSSSLSISSVRKSRFCPPYSSGRNAAGLRPSLCAFLTTSYGNSSVSSKWAATGRISLAAKSWASSRIACCSSVSVKSSGIVIVQRRQPRLELRVGLGEDDVAVLVDGANLQTSGLGWLRAESDGVTGLDHARKAACEPAEPLRTTRGLAGNHRGDAHLKHAVRDHARQADGASELLVQVDRVHVAGGTRVRGDLFGLKKHTVLCHDRITNSARDVQTGEPSLEVVSVSRVTNRRPRRLTSDATRAREVTVSPTFGCRFHSNSCSACSSFPKSMAASSSPKSCGAVAPSE